VLCITLLAYIAEVVHREVVMVLIDCSNTSLHTTFYTATTAATAMCSLALVVDVVPFCCTLTSDNTTSLLFENAHGCMRCCRVL
jgi:hypothetical protein